MMGPRKEDFRMTFGLCMPVGPYHLSMIYNHQLLKALMIGAEGLQSSVYSLMDSCP